MNPHNPHAEAQRQLFGMLHRIRSFFPTARQRQLLNDLTSAPNPGLALLGYGGAMGGGKTRAIVELALDAALAYPNNPKQRRPRRPVPVPVPAPEPGPARSRPSHAPHRSHSLQLQPTVSLRSTPDHARRGDTMTLAIHPYRYPSPVRCLHAD